MEILQKFCENVKIGTIKENKGMNRENQRPYKAIIIGGGASGLVLAISLATKFGGDNILLIEKLDRVGKKLLSTGNGRCNLSNVDNEFIHYHSENNGYFNEIINRYSNKVPSFFSSIGVPFSVEDGKVYPLSKQASSVVDALRFKLESIGVNTVISNRANQVKKSNNKFRVLCENGEEFVSENVIVSVGGKSQKHLGTDGSSYSLLTDFKHTLTNLYPSIVQLKVKDLSRIKGLKGLKQKVSAKAIVNGKLVSKTQGDLMFTDYGLSGNAIFYLSSYLAGEKNGVVEIDFCPELTKEELNKLLIEKQSDCSYLKGEYLLMGVMNSKISQSLLRNESVGNLQDGVNSFNISKVISAVKNYKIEVNGTMGFDQAQVTKGGIKANEFNPLTLESKFASGLYATGEVLDVDGDCGGYNLNWAFCSALAVADSIL